MKFEVVLNILMLLLKKINETREITVVFLIVLKKKKKPSVLSCIQTFMDQFGLTIDTIELHILILV